MAKDKPRRITQKDTYQRINYLYQAAHIACSMTPPNLVLAKYYAALMVKIGRRNVIRLSPELKRTICKSCFVPLLPGITSKCEFEKDKVLVVKCVCCGCKKRYPTKTNPCFPQKDTGKSQSAGKVAAGFATRQLWHYKKENVFTTEVIQPQKPFSTASVDNSNTKKAKPNSKKKAAKS